MPFFRLPTGVFFSLWRYANISRRNSQLIALQGLPAICLGIITVFILPDRPESTPFLNERERELAMARMNRGTSGDVGATVNKGKLLPNFDIQFDLIWSLFSSYWHGVPGLESLYFPLL